MVNTRNRPKAGIIKTKGILHEPYTMDPTHSGRKEIQTYVSICGLY